MLQTFYKYQGTGNDFVMIDNRTKQFAHDVKVISQLCDRRFGIGADGLILIEEHPTLDFDMIYFNADGSQSLCGNGSRCAVAFAKFLKIIESDTNFQTIDGPLQAKVVGDLVHLKMNDQPAPENHETFYFLDNGSPHHMEFVADASTAPVFDRGAEVRYSQRYEPAGTNVNFVQLQDNSIFVRTYERGVENETLSCGTGVTASALTSALKGLKSPVPVQTKGGNLQVKFKQKQDGSFENIWLIGPASYVFAGEITL